MIEELGFVLRENRNMEVLFATSLKFLLVMTTMGDIILGPLGLAACHTRLSANE